MAQINNETMMEFLIHEKVYVVIGDEMPEEEALLTLNWVINKWVSHHPISIVLFYVFSFTSSDVVFSPLGKLPASAVSDDMLQLLKNSEEQKIDQLLSRYVASCTQVDVEVHKVEKHDEPIQNIVVNLIFEHRITKLVMGVTFMRSFSGTIDLHEQMFRRSKRAVSGSFYVLRNKPEFCELFVVCKGKMMILKEENEGEGVMEDEQGIIVAKLKPKAGFKGWLGKMLSNGNGKTQVCPSLLSTSTSSGSISPRNHWEKYEQEIDEYFQELLLLESSESNSGEEKVSVEENSSSGYSQSEQEIPVSFQDVGNRCEALKKEIQATRDMIELNKKKAKTEVDRQAKASWAICLCNRRAEELEASMTEEISFRNELTKELDNTKEQLYEIQTDVQESKDRLSSLVELQSELSAKLQVALPAKARVEAQLQSSASTRTDIVREIEELRKQRDIFQRRIEFCKEKDAIGMANRMVNDQVSCSYREFNADEIRLATDNFAAHRRLKSCGDLTDVYKGRIKSTTVAIKMLGSDKDFSQEVLKAKVNLLGNIRHPHITALLGFCSDLKCLVFEYMHNGCLGDVLFTRRKSRTLQWHHRIQIAAQVSSTLGFLNLAKPTPIIHKALNPSNVFLDRNFVAKIHSFELTPSSGEGDVQAEVAAFGVLLLQLLTGRSWDDGVDLESMMNDKQGILEVLDDNAGDWPLDLAEEVAKIAMRCLSESFEGNAGAVNVMTAVADELSNLKKVAVDLIARIECETENEDVSCPGVESSCVPSIFLCPILQVVMENPHVAADGCSYEFEAIEEWLRMGHDTSPVTNSKFTHKHLTPNITLRLLIQEWHHNKPSPSSSS